MPLIQSILLDIEGTIAPLAFVRDVLFPYARLRLDDYLAEHWDAAEVIAAREQIARDAATDATTPDALLGVARLEAAAKNLPASAVRRALVAHLHALMDRDAKTTGLKLLQGLIWERGFAAGVLRAPLFDEVVPTLHRWRKAGIALAIYSSGSRAAQRLFLAHTDGAERDVTALFEGFFDTTVGPKRAAASYARIALEWKRAAATMLFVSDVVEELDAARAAGLQTCLALRPGNAPTTAGTHPTITRLDEIGLGS